MKIIQSLIAFLKERRDLVNWLEFYTKNKNNPLIRDLIIEGLSLARTQKEIFIYFEF